MELYDPDGQAIGYLGIEYRDGLPRSQVDEIPLVRQAAARIITAFLAPVEHLTLPEEGTE